MPARPPTPSAPSISAVPVVPAAAIRVTPTIRAPSCGSGIRGRGSSRLTPAGTSAKVAAMNSRLWIAKNQKAPRHQSASANRPPIRGPSRVATPQTPARPASTRTHSRCGNMPLIAT